MPNWWRSGGLYARLAVAAIRGHVAHEAVACRARPRRRPTRWPCWWSLALFLRRALDLGQRRVFPACRPALPGSCKTVAAVPGIGGYRSRRPDGMIVSSPVGQRRAAPDAARRHLCSDADGAAPPVKLAGTPKDFHPRGISLYRAPGGEPVPDGGQPSQVERPVQHRQLSTYRRRRRRPR